MPREHRKRGKKNKKKDQEKVPDAHGVNDYDPPPHEEQHAGPSWIVPNPKVEAELNLDAPFGYVDPDIKAYFRTVDVQIREWQGQEVGATEENMDIDPNEERRLFFVAALTEMSGKEKQLATDPDGSNILERMTYSMDDFVRRVFLDSLTGSYETLVKHRFSSHVCQTLFIVGADTIDRECRGVFPSIPESSNEGELRTFTQLVQDICEELFPTLPTLLMDPYASHVIRTLLSLLRPTIFTPGSDGVPLLNQPPKSSIRSKKSAAFKARQGPMKSVFADASENVRATRRDTPEVFRQTAYRFVQTVRDGLDANEVRALAADKVASPVLQLLLEVEADQSQSDEPDSLMDRVLVGIITAYHKDPESIPEPSDYLSTLLRDPTASHLLETLVARAPPSASAILWSTYFRNKLARLAVHPVANFVVARVIEAVTVDQLQEVLQELEGTWGKVIKASRSGVLRAVVDRAASLRSHEEAVGKAVCMAFDCTAEDQNVLASCILLLKTPQEYRSLLESIPPETKEEPEERKPHKPHGKREADPLAPTIQGSLLLQSLLLLAEPHNLLITDSIKSLPMNDLLALAHNATSSRVLDAILDSPTVPFKAKRAFVMSFIGHYHILVDDRIGSRVGDRCWAFADPYLKEKIARSLIPYESFLAGSFYGKFFARNLNLYLLQRRPDEWKDLQAKSKAPLSIPAPQQKEAQLADKTAKKRKRTEDEIDAVFSTALGKKTKKGTLSTGGAPHGSSMIRREKTSEAEHEAELGLDDVLGAIRAAPKDEKGHGKRNRGH